MRTGSLGNQVPRGRTAHGQRGASAFTGTAPDRRVNHAPGKLPRIRFHCLEEVF